MELLFLLSFTLHNIEEGLWLPKWSKHTGKYYPQVSNREFHFALLVITSVGYFITFTFLLFGQASEVVKYVFLGFVLMMSFNAIFPHLLATIVLKRYAPGTLTGLLLNVPIGSAIIMKLAVSALNKINDVKIVMLSFKFRVMQCKSISFDELIPYSSGFYLASGLDSARSNHLRI